MEQLVTYLSKNCFNINGQVSVWAAVSPDDTETKSVGSSIESDGLILRWADEKRRQLGTELKYFIVLAFNLHTVP